MNRPSRAVTVFAAMIMMTASVSFAVTAQTPDPSTAFSAADAAVGRAIEAGRIPGAVLVAGRRDGVVYHKAYGRRGLEAEGFGPMTEDTVFDLASLTKPIATATSVLVLIDERKLRLTDRVSAHLPEFKGGGKDGITVEQCLRHTAGLIADNPLSDYAGTPEQAWERICGLGVRAAPGTRFEYSDVGFIVLGKLVERISGKPLEVFARERVLTPLGMSDSGYRPGERLRSQAAPTEKRGGKWIVGDVHDPRAWALGGAAGHAGLFGTADDVAKWCRMVLGEGSSEGGRVLRAETVRAMGTGAGPSVATTRPAVRGLGVDVDSSYSPAPRGELFATGSTFGHTGWTGTCLWIDPANDAFYVLLTNRVHPDGKGEVAALRRQVATAVGAALLGKPVPADLAQLGAPSTAASASATDAGATTVAPSPGTTGGSSAPAAPRAVTPRAATSPASPASSGTAQSPPPSDGATAAASLAPRGAGEATGGAQARPAHSALPTTRPPTTRTSAAPSPVLTGIDVLKRDRFAALRGKRVGLITNHSGRDLAGNRTIDLLLSPEAQAAGVTLVRLFSPEHGLFGNLDEKIGHGSDSATGLFVYSLYGQYRKPTTEMLEGLDALVFDIQDAGARFYTYSATLGFCMEAAALNGLEFVVLDRPNPIRGDRVDGPVADARFFGFTAYGPVPVQHGMTFGELAQLYTSPDWPLPATTRNAPAPGAAPSELDITADEAKRRLPRSKLTVVKMQGWRRGMWFDEANVPWVSPSPNLRNLNQVTIYTATCLLEAANLSVGRGTDEPFVTVGAPWVDGRAWAAALNGAGLPGVRFYPVEFTPDRGSKLGGQLCRGVYVLLTDRSALEPVRTGLTMAWCLRKLHGEQFDHAKVRNLLQNQRLQDAWTEAADPAKLSAMWKDDVTKFLKLRRPFLLYE